MFKTCSKQIMSREESSEVGSRRVKQLWEIILGFASPGVLLFPSAEHSTRWYPQQPLTDNNAHTAPDSARTPQTEHSER